MARSALASRPRRIGAPRQAPVSIPGTTTHRVLPPRKRPNTYWRSREYLTPAEVDTLISTAKRLGRHGHRDATMIQLAYRHGLRVAELIALRWDQVDLRDSLLHVRRRPVVLEREAAGRAHVGLDLPAGRTRERSDGGGQVVRGREAVADEEHALR